MTDELTEVERGLLVKALHDAETTGGFWGEHPECQEFADVVAPTVERILADRLAVARAEALTEAADEVHKEARWQTEQKARMAAMSDIRATLEYGGSIQRLVMLEQILTDRAHALDPRCHCGDPVAYGFDGDQTHHRDMCEHCDATRCDAYPGECRRPDRAAAVARDGEGT